MITSWDVLGRVGWVVSDNVLGCIGQSGGGGGWLVITSWGVLGRVGWVVSDNVLGCFRQSWGKVVVGS